MFSPCAFVCLFVCVYVCHDVCPDNLTMKDWCHTNNILLVHCWGCLVVQVMFRTHDVIDDVTRSQSRSNFEIDISPMIFELRRRSKTQNVGMLMAIFLVYSTSGIASGKKVSRELKMAAILKNLKY